MKNHVLLFTILILLLLASGPLKAQQEYQTAIGLRLGYPASVTLKHFLDDSHAVEVYAGTRGWSTYRWYHVAGAYQFHKEIEDLDGLRYYFGGGASVFFWNYDFERAGLSSTSLGIQGYVGLDYTFKDLPINLTLDWIPTLYLGDAFTTGFAGGFGTLGVRYIID